MLAVHIWPMSNKITSQFVSVYANKRVRTKLNFILIGANWQLRLRRLFCSSRCHNSLMLLGVLSTYSVPLGQPLCLCLPVTSDTKASISVSYAKAFQREMCVALLLNSVMWYSGLVLSPMLTLCKKCVNYKDSILKSLEVTLDLHSEK